MSDRRAPSHFTATLLRPKKASTVDFPAFIVLPREVSDTLPRRGRTTITGALDGHAFEALLEPDGQKSHWLKVTQEMLDMSGASIGEDARFELCPIAQEPEPELPEAFALALKEFPEARATWDATTTLARVDWVHWMVSARQEKTRQKRVRDACDMLSSGKKKVCCFDPSGYYSKAFRAPEADLS